MENPALPYSEYSEKMLLTDMEFHISLRYGKRLIEHDDNAEFERKMRDLHADTTVDQTLFQEDQSSDEPYQGGS